MRLLMALAILGSSIGFPAGAQTLVSTDIVSSVTWGGVANPSPIVLQGVITVRDGATLTILPGTIVRGQPRRGPVSTGSYFNAPGTLLVSRTGRIQAVGTISLPIIFTTAATDNNNDGIADDANSDGFRDSWESGDLFLDDTPTTAPLAPLDKAGNSNTFLWGGVVVLGEAPTNVAEKTALVTEAVTSARSSPTRTERTEGARLPTTPGGSPMYRFDTAEGRSLSHHNSPAA